MLALLWVSARMAGVVADLQAPDGRDRDPSVHTQPGSAALAEPVATSGKAMHSQVIVGGWRCLRFAAFSARRLRRAPPA